MNPLKPKKSRLQILQRLKERRAYLEFSRKYGQIGFNPGYFQLIKVLVLTFPKKSDFFNFHTHKAIVREWRANRFPEDLGSSDQSLPTIEILIVAAGKDIELLPDVLKGAIANSLNPISGITLIIPVVDKKQCEKIIQAETYPSEIKVVLEDDLLDEAIRNKIKLRFNKRYGWVLQQLLSVEFILNSKAAGVLLLDADTVLLRKVAWLDSKGNQKLLVGPAYHRPYHKLLNKLINTDAEPKTTHVTHHMLLQPIYLRDIFQKFKLVDTRNLLDLLVENADQNEESALSVDFELYAQAILRLYPQKVELRKFSNISVTRSKSTNYASLKKEYSDFNSVSMHSYLESEM